MSRISCVRYLYLAYFSKPKPERKLYRQIHKGRFKRIVQVGVGDAERACRILQVALRSAQEEVHFTGIDLFEASGPDGLPLIEAHRKLSKLGAQVRLVPGDPTSALTSVANASPNCDLILLSASATEEDLRGAWFYLPRMMHPGTLVLRETLTTEGEPSFQQLTPLEVQAAAQQTRQHTQQRRAA